MNKNKAIILCVVIVVVTIIAAFYILNSGKTTSPAYSNINENLVVSEKKPSKNLKGYSDDAGFSFQYPDDVLVKKIDINDSITYSNVELTSIQAKGKMLIKVVDTQLKSIDDLFVKEGLRGEIKEIKIGEISGKEANMNNKIIAAALDQSVLFTIEVDSQNQKYWVDVYQTVLSSFNFVPQQASPSVPFDSSSDDVVLEEEIVE